MTFSSSTYSTGVEDGTPLDFFDLSMAMAPGWSESTFLAQMAKALAYWQRVQATSNDGRLLFAASLAIPWIQAEQTRVQSPPLNSMHVIYPV